MDILKKIDKLRKDRGWSVYKFAEKCEITPSTIANMFSRGTMPSLNTLILICKGCGITLSEFFADDEDEIQSIDEQELLNSYRKLNDKNKSAIRQFMENVS